MSENSDLLTFGFAENSLAGPIECLRHIFKEMTKVGHTVYLYTYLTEPTEEQSTDMAAFIKELDVPSITEFMPRADCIADMYFDHKCFGNFPGIYNVFGSMLREGFILTTSQNEKLMKDVKFWETGEQSSGIINPAVPKIIGLHD